MRGIVAEVLNLLCTQYCAPNTSIYSHANTYIGYTIVMSERRNEKMTAQFAKAFHSERIGRYEKMRCPKNYCTHREALRRNKDY
jgi:hypothetical protein